MHPKGTKHESHGHNRVGKTTTTYRAWQGMKARCKAESKKNRKWYFDRGIKVCKRWQKFSAFLADMGLKPLGMQLERKDNAKGYTPKNCTWATPRQNCRNKRNNRRLQLKGLEQTVTEWAEQLGMPVPTLFSRVYSGKPTLSILAR